MEISSVRSPYWRIACANGCPTGHSPFAELMCRRRVTLLQYPLELGRRRDVTQSLLRRLPSGL